MPIPLNPHRNNPGIRLIAYRGNTNGIDLQQNTLPYILDALEAGYEVMIDVWTKNRGTTICLDSDCQTAFDQYMVQYREQVWYQARTPYALQQLLMGQYRVHYLPEDEEYHGQYMMTSHGQILCCGVPALSARGIYLFPEFLPVGEKITLNCQGIAICSNNVATILQNNSGQSLSIDVQRKINGEETTDDLLEQHIMLVEDPTSNPSEIAKIEQILNQREQAGEACAQNWKNLHQFIMGCSEPVDPPSSTQSHFQSP